MTYSHVCTWHSHHEFDAKNQSEATLPPSVARYIIEKYKQFMLKY